MTVALLVVIVLILLFGAGVVKGWLTNLVALGCGGLAILMALLWLGSFFGENGVTYVMYAVGAILFALLIARLAIGAGSAGAGEATPNRPSPTAANSSPLSTELRDKVWQRWAPDIAHNFSADARARAQDLFFENDHAALEQFCREEMKRSRK
jgi:hypothetical protein